MAETGRSSRRRVLLLLLSLHRLLGELSALDAVLDVFFLLSSLLSVAPPHWSLVIASQP